METKLGQNVIIVEGETFFCTPSSPPYVPILRYFQAYRIAPWHPVMRKHFNFSSKDDFGRVGNPPPPWCLDQSEMSL